MTSEELTLLIRDFAARRNWEQFHTPKNLSMALSAEAGELLAEFQWLTQEEGQVAANPSPLRDRVIDEVADVAIYLLRLADVLDVDLDAAVRSKLDRNEQRFEALTGNSWLGEPSPESE